MTRMYRDDIVLSASNQDTEPDRLVRLQRVIGYLCAAAEYSDNRELLSKIAKLHDHKGILNVTWHSDPSDDEKGLLTKAWESPIGDGSDCVEHFGP